MNCILFKNESRIVTSFLYLLPFFIVATLGTLLVSNNIFFWDTIQLGAKHATFYYDNNFSELLLPDNMDSGHIPAFGMYLALCWKLFGKTLIVSHFSMLPFVFGTIWQLYILLKKFISQKFIYWSLLIILFDPTLLGQFVLVSPDIPLLFLFLMGLNAVLTKNNKLITVATAGLFLISMRGMMVAFALLVIDIIINTEFSGISATFKQLLKKSLIYLPSLLIFISFNIYHFYIKGWIGYHEDSPWSDCFVRANFWEGIFNIAILGWRLMDFGRIFIWVIGGIIVFMSFKRTVQEKNVRLLTLVFLITLATLSVTFILYKNLSGHRYLLPAIVIFSVLVQYLIFEVVENKRLKYIFSIIAFVGITTGNLWVYPPNIAQGWDSTLAHIPYYKLRNKMMDYIEEQDIEVNDVSSFFPNKAELRYLDLSNDTDIHSSFYPNISTYVLNSNIYNITDDELSSLNSDYVLLKTFSKTSVYVQLYKKK